MDAHGTIQTVSDEAGVEGSDELMAGSPDPEPQENKMLTAAEVAAYLDVSQQTIRRWIKDENLPYMQVGTLLRFDPVKLQEWIDERSHGGSTPPESAPPSN